MVMKVLTNVLHIISWGSGVVDCVVASDIQIWDGFMLSKMLVMKDNYEGIKIKQLAPGSIQINKLTLHQQANACHCKAPFWIATKRNSHTGFAPVFNRSTYQQLKNITEHSPQYRTPVPTQCLRNEGESPARIQSPSVIEIEMITANEPTQSID